MIGSTMKSHNMKIWVNEKNNITNAEAMKKALDSYWCIKVGKLLFVKLAKTSKEKCQMERNKSA